MPLIFNYAQNLEKKIPTLVHFEEDFFYNLKLLIENTF